MLFWRSSAVAIGGRDLLEACAWLDELWRSCRTVLQSWSLDLIQNLPGHNFDHWDDQLCQAMATQAPHLSIYDLSIEPGTVFAKQGRVGASSSSRG